MCEKGIEKKFEYKENVRMKIKLRDNSNNLLIGLDEFLKEVEVKCNDKFDDYCELLLKEYTKIGNAKDPSKSLIKYVEKIIEQYENKPDSILSKNLELLRSSIQAILSLANFDEYKDQHENEEIEMKTTDIIYAMNVFDYYQISSLSTIMSKDDAIELTISYLENILESRRNPDKYLKNLDGLIERFTPGYERWQCQTSQFKKSGEGKLILKVSRCAWADVMKGLDSEISYSFICNSDFKNATILNPDFILTRKKTLMQGDSYCDFCYHDSRIDKELEHPSEQDFDNVV
ncbi:MAG: L-2-amino-thiazoline-4-carboxylic acid hydrolase [Promethearchaeota archaeon]